ncbi:MAG: hypothetical protein ACQEQV_02325 [Fibrobacterota bacterium]
MKYTVAALSLLFLFTAVLHATSPELMYHADDNYGDTLKIITDSPDLYPYLDTLTADDSLDLPVRRRDVFGDTVIYSVTRNSVVPHSRMILSGARFTQQKLTTYDRRIYIQKAWYTDAKPADGFVDEVAFSLTGALSPGASISADLLDIQFPHRRVFTPRGALQIADRVLRLPVTESVDSSETGTAAADEYISTDACRVDDTTFLGGAWRVPVHDSLAPVLRSLMLQPGEGRMDTLRVRFSEPPGADVILQGELLQNQSGTVITVIDALHLNGAEWLLQVPAGAVRVGDSLALSGNIPVADDAANTCGGDNHAVAVAPMSLAADYNGDHCVDILDLIIAGTYWDSFAEYGDISRVEECGPLRSGATAPYTVLDIREDGQYDYQDLSVFSAMWSWSYRNDTGGSFRAEGQRSAPVCTLGISRERGKTLGRLHGVFGDSLYAFSMSMGLARESRIEKVYSNEFELLSGQKEHRARVDGLRHRDLPDAQEYDTLCTVEFGGHSSPPETVYLRFYNDSGRQVQAGPAVLAEADHSKDTTPGVTALSNPVVPAEKAYGMQMHEVSAGLLHQGAAFLVDFPDNSEESMPLTLTVYDYLGSRVAHQRFMYHSEDEKIIYWDGRNNRGAACASGTYRVVLESPDSGDRWVTLLGITKKQ